MKALSKKKKIIVPFNGKIAPLGVMGPIDIPYFETFENITQLVMHRYKVIEILKDGTKVPLTIANFDKENGGPGNESIITEYSSPKRRRNQDHAVIVVDDESLKKKSDSELLRKSTRVVSRELTKNIESSSTEPAANGATKVFVSPKQQGNKKKYPREEIQKK